MSPRLAVRLPAADGNEHPVAVDRVVDVGPARSPRSGASPDHEEEPGDHGRRRRSAGSRRGPAPSVPRPGSGRRRGGARSAAGARARPRRRGSGREDPSQAFRPPVAGRGDPDLAVRIELSPQTRGPVRFPGGLARGQGSCAVGTTIVSSPLVITADDPCSISERTRRPPPSRRKERLNARLDAFLTRDRDPELFGLELLPHRAPSAPLRSASTARISWSPRAGRHCRAAPRCGSVA